MNFFTNTLLGIVTFAFITVFVLFGLEFYKNNKFVEAGLQQCKVGNEILWQKECNNQ